MDGQTDRHTYIKNCRNGSSTKCWLVETKDGGSVLVCIWGRGRSEDRKTGKHKITKLRAFFFGGGGER